MSGPFGENAAYYWRRGLCVLPIVPGTKKPAQSGWQGCTTVPNSETQADWLERFAGHGVGLLLGTEIRGDVIIVAIDVDDDALVPVTAAILGTCVSAKRGAKGETFFARAIRGGIKSTTVNDANKAGKIDILASGRQTVLPPTIHPETAKPYAWTGTPLEKCDLELLPEFTPRKLDLLRLVVGSPYAATLITGQTTHDPGVALTAQLVAVGCSVGEIEGIVRALLPQDYHGDSLDELPGWIKSARAKGFDKAGHLPLDDEIAHQIEQQLNPLAFIPGEGFRAYRDGYWPPLSERDVDRLAKKLISPRLSAGRQVGPMLSGVRRCLELNVERNDFGRARSVGRIGVRNGVYNVATREFEAHAPGQELRFRLDFDFDESAACPIYVEQLERTLAGNQQAMDLFEEFAALTLVPDMRFQKALYLIGEAGCGKSTLLRVVESMHDPDAVTVTPLDKIDDERYLTDLVRKLACISFDVQTRKNVFGEAFMRITGGDPVAIRKLYHEVEGRVVPTVRFIGSMNFDAPRATSAADALQRRLIFLRCGARVATPDPDRDAELKAERPGILLRWIAALQRLYDRGSFDIPADSVDEVRDYTTTQDPVALYAQERLEPDRTGAIPTAQISQDYAIWADEHGERRLPANALGRKLRALGFENGFGRHREADRRLTCRIVKARFRQPSPSF